MEGLTPTSLSSAPSLTALYTSAHSPPSAAHLPKKQHDKAQEGRERASRAGASHNASVTVETHVYGEEDPGGGALVWTSQCMSSELAHVQRQTAKSELCQHHAQSQCQLRSRLLSPRT
ncbi:hypothetical protein Q7C36_003298 [Tachysurus vachellii]|uniref:Uncharacterized protein n=1 Tax=Tachysurus vachellii TaxID=175792 RepID=A0AA88NV92_TACVA|nr:hypothetical protein Q7C36_003298 [Tachysurus vachellii]